MRKRKGGSWTPKRTVRRVGKFEEARTVVDDIIEKLETDDNSLVQRVRSKFTTPEPESDPKLEFEIWKKEREKGEEGPGEKHEGLDKAG